ncbi:MAG: hypothetical protein DI635_10700 [Pseudoxanthomonas suwonensis]|nr:MAG: hypothetical protein DI635_10700 [Pseudoxanthomonas suwonensis]
MNSSIPTYEEENPDGIILWFAEMSARGLLFHPEEDPSAIIRIGDGLRTFSETEAADARAILSRMFDRHGDRVIEACYPVFMHACGQRLDA